MAAHQTLNARSEILVSIPGFGNYTAFALLIDMPELGTMDAKQTASLAGLAPLTRQSGNWKGKSFIQGGRATLRQALYMPALVAIRFSTPKQITSSLRIAATTICLGLRRPASSGARRVR